MQLLWHEPVPPVPLTLAWMNSWTCLGVVGMHTQDYDAELRQFPHGWRANFYQTGIAHSVVSGSA